MKAQIAFAAMMAALLASAGYATAHPSEDFQNETVADYWSPADFFFSSASRNYGYEPRCGVDENQYKIIAFGRFDGAGLTWVQTNDSRHCPEAGISDNFWTQNRD
jgi:hypothetical protein